MDRDGRQADKQEGLCLLVFKCITKMQNQNYMDRLWKKPQNKAERFTESYATVFNCRLTSQECNTGKRYALTSKESICIRHGIDELSRPRKTVKLRSFQNISKYSLIIFKITRFDIHLKI